MKPNILILHSFLPSLFPQQHGKFLGADRHRGDQDHRHGVRHHHDADLPDPAATLEAESAGQTRKGNGLIPMTKKKKIKKNE